MRVGAWAALPGAGSAPRTAGARHRQAPDAVDAAPPDLSTGRRTRLGRGIGPSMTTRRLPFTVELRQPVLGVTTRVGWLIEGDAGWAEWSPLPSWSRQEVVTAYRGALEAAEHPFPTPLRDRVEVNAMVPRVPADIAARMAVASACGTVNVKVGDRGGEARAEALRLDANGAGSGEEAQRALARLAHLGIELVEDPVPTLAEMAILRRRSPVPIAAEMPIRTVDDVHELYRLQAADVLVIKPQRLGGIRASLRAAQLARRD